VRASPPAGIVAEPPDDAEKVTEEAQALRPPHGNADLAATFTTVEDMLRQSPGKFEDREVYFFTDLQRSTWITRQNGDPATLLQRIQDRARTVFVDVGQDGMTNAAVTNLALGAPFVTTGTATPVVVTLHQYGAEP